VPESRPGDTTSPGDLHRSLRARISRLLDPAGHDYGRAEETAGRLANRVVAALLKDGERATGPTAGSRVTPSKAAPRAETGSGKTAR
jgi:hypothetical protein